MKDYLTTHKFKSVEMKKKMQETMASMKPEDIVKSTTGPNAVCQSSFVSPGDDLIMFCHWKAESEEAINEQLGPMNDFYEPHKHQVIDQIMDFNKMRS